MVALPIVVLLLMSAGRFPEVVPTFRPASGALSGDTLAVLTSPQQLIPSFCPSVAVAEDELFIAVPADSCLFVLHGFLGGEWDTITAVGPCDTLSLGFSFPGLTARGNGPPALTTIVQRLSGGVPYAFFQEIDPLSPDSCSTSGIVITDSAPDSAAAPHDPALVIPSAAGSLTAVSVWDPTTWDSFLFTSHPGDGAFVPEPEAWSSAMPRPDTLPGGPAVIAIGPSGEITACIMAEGGDSAHIGLQPWVTRSTDSGASWEPLVPLPSQADGSALDGQPGSMPYGSFRGGTSWYAPQVVYAGETPCVFWTARRAPGDTVTAEERRWPSARAMLCSYPTESGWRTAYVGMAMTDSARTYGTADWPTVVLDRGNAVLLWSDLSDDGTNLDVWACGHDAGTGAWTVPVALTSTTGSEAFLEAARPLAASDGYVLLCADARLLFGEPAALMASTLALDEVWDSGARTDVLPSPASGHPPRPENLTVRVFPNPATGSFSLSPSTAGVMDLAIYDLAGRMRMHVRDDAAGRGPISVGGLPAGSYVIVWGGPLARGTLPLVVR